MCQHNLPCSIVYAHCLLPGRAFASLHVLLFLEKEAEIGGRVIVLTRSNFDHYTREWGFGILKKKNKTCSSSNSLATTFWSTVMSPMGENELAPLEGGSESPSPVKAD